MHDDGRQVEEHVDRVLREVVRPARHGARCSLQVSAWEVPGEPVPVGEARTARYRPVAVGERWGRPWSTTWFRLLGTVPPQWRGCRVEAVIDLGFEGGSPGFQAEGLVYDLAGRVVKGVHPLNRHVPVTAGAAGGEDVGYLVEAAANPSVPLSGPPTRLGSPGTAGDEPLYRVHRADLVVVRDDVRHLALDLAVLLDLMRALPHADLRRHQVLRGLERALDHLDLDDVAGTCAAVRARVRPLLDAPATAGAHLVSAVGHAHLDTAWLWPVRETRRKAARTLATVLSLAAEYPELVYAASQAQQLAWVREDHPELFARVVEAVRAGTVVPVGGTWVEPDGNLPGGEAMARQLVHGKRFFLEAFGVETRGVWLPDSFGYSAALPQLALLAGNDWFLTQKISWNQTNAFPHHSFWWEGIDGSRIFTHFPPADTYGGTLSGAELARAVGNYADKGGGNRSLLPFGHGDGGGGPTPEMLERARRTADLEGSPRVRIEPPDAFFEAARAEYPDAAVWSGELYLELHRGTFTTQARTKAGNRRNERLLREAELWATTAVLRAPGRYRYPAADLDRLWQQVLLLQFHDVLPGSSISWVHAEAEATHAQVSAELEALTRQALAAVTDPDGDPDGEGTGAVGRAGWVVNGSPFARREVVATPAGPVTLDLPALGAARATGGGLEHPVRVSAGADGTVLENALVRVTLAPDGTLASVRDLGAGGGAGREALAPGAPGNLLVLHPDLPNQWDAWDVDRHYRRTGRELRGAEAVEVVDRGPAEGAVRVTRRFGGSRLVQTVVVRAGSRRVDVRTEADWHEREKLLKAAFPLDVHADRAASEVQFGHVHRPTHTNTSWDAARFETWAHRWVHVGEPGYGIGVLTDSTYGHDVGRTTRAGGGTTTTVRLSLLRAPRRPDPEADQGRHTFGYALLPGADVAGTVAEAYAFTVPLRTVTGAGSAPWAPVVRTEGDAGAVVEAVKMADDGSGDVVVRVYEAFGGRATAMLVPGFAAGSAVLTDLLERPLPGGTPQPAGAGLRLELRPFQVVTVRWTRA